MTIRLTKEMRATIKKVIYEATVIPGKLLELEKEIKKFFTNWAKTKVPKDFTDATKHLPKNWLCSRMHIEAQYGTTYNSPENTNSSWTTSTSIYFNDPIHVPNDFQFPTFTRTDLKEFPELQELLKETIIWKEKQVSTKQELENTLKAYSTVDKLLKDFPEFAKHCPEKPVYAIAVNPDKVAVNLMNVGFDITVKPVNATPVPVVNTTKPKASDKVAKARKPRVKKVVV